MMVKIVQKSSFWRIVLFLCAVAVAGPVLAAPAPIDVIRTGTQRALKLLRENCRPGETVHVQAHRDEILQIVYDYFDFEEMGRRALGRHWKGQTPENQKEYVKLFEELLFSTYLDRVETYTCSEEDVEYDGERVEGDYALVKTRIVGYQGTEIPVEYRLRLKKSEWKVYDVVVEGISLVNNYRSQFDSILNRSSFDDLLKLLREKKIAQPASKS